MLESVSRSTSSLPCLSVNYTSQLLSTIYSFGQVKPVYVYRLVAFGTIEDRIYARQVTKESVSGRVVDEHQIGRHFESADLNALYDLKVDTYDASEAPAYTVPEDHLLANVFVNLKEGVVNYEQVWSTFTSLMCCSMTVYLLMSKTKC
jgi:hypothetical protein